MNNYISDFKKLPTNLVYAFDKPGDQIDVLNNLINQCISDYAPTKKVKFTCPPAPWMEDPEIISASWKPNKYTTSLESYRTQRPSKLPSCKDKLQKTIRSKKATFLRKTLGFKNPKEVCETVNRILDPWTNQIEHSPGDLSRYYTELAPTHTNKENIAFEQSLLYCTFVIQHTTYTEIKNIISELRNNCSSGCDNTLVKFLNLLPRR